MNKYNLQMFYLQCSYFKLDDVTAVGRSLIKATSRLLQQKGINTEMSI